MYCTMNGDGFWGYLLQHQSLEIQIIFLEAWNSSFQELSNIHICSLNSCFQANYMSKTTYINSPTKIVRLTKYCKSLTIPISRMHIYISFVYFSSFYFDMIFCHTKVFFPTSVFIQLLFDIENNQNISSLLS